MTTLTQSPSRRRAIPTGEPLRRAALKLDAAVTGANGLAYLAVAGPLSDLFGVPASFLRPVGAFLLAFSAVVWIVASRRTVGPGAVTAVAVVNAVWVVDSFVLLAAGWYDPALAGAIWIGLQALVVGAFAALQAASARSGR